MLTEYRYELWNGREVVGYYCCSFKLMGTHLVQTYLSPLKEIYGRKAKEVKVPISYRITWSDDIDTHFITVLDVRKKSKAQIDILRGHK